MLKRTALFALLLSFWACSDDDENQDNIAPNILSVTMNGEDHDLSFTNGATINLAAEVSDNEGLGQLKIDIHDLFDGHSHGKLDGGDAWEMTKIVSLSGSSTTVNETMTVPDPVVAGQYHVILQLLDAAGNEAEFEELEFVITNGEEPQINISSPTFDGLHIDEGMKLELVGMVTDNEDLDEIVITISEEDDHNHKNQSGEIFEFDVDLDGSADTSYDLSQVDITIPVGTEEGDYKIVISAKDNEGNYGIFEAEFHVHK